MQCIDMSVPDADLYLSRLCHDDAESTWQVCTVTREWRVGENAMRADSASPP